MVMNYRDLVKTILTIDDWYHNYTEHYNRFIQNYTPLEDGNSAQRIYNGCSFSNLTLPLGDI